MGQVHRFSRRLRWAVPGGVVVVAGAVLAGTMLANAAAPALPRRTPAQLLLAMRHATLPRAMTAVVSQSANLGFPALPDIAGMPSSALSATSLLTGTHTIEIWYAGPRHLRLALPVSFGETDLRVNGDQVWLWDSSGQSATRYIVPALPAPGSARHWFKPVPAGKPVRISTPKHHASPGGAGPSVGHVVGLTPLQVVRRVLAIVGRTTKVTVASTVKVAGRPAYQLVIAPRSHRSLIDRILIAIDAKTHLPLDVQVFARGSSSPAFHIGFTSLTIGRPAMSNFTFTPPPGAHVKTSTLPASLPGFGPGTAGPPAIPGVEPGGAKVPAGPLARPQILGSGWLAVAVLPVGTALAVASAGGAGLPGGHGAHVVLVRGSAAPGKGSTAYQSTLRISGPAGQIPALLGLLLKATTAVHGSWGSGRLLRTSLVSVLITSKGQVLIGAVTPSVLYADAAKVK